MPRLRLLFVCVANSCRSQMADGFAKRLGGDAVEVHSAGSDPSGNVSKEAIDSMRGKGIDISNNDSIGVGDLPPLEWDWVVTMGCGDACPQLPAKNRADWSIVDPYERPQNQFDDVRDDIERRVAELLRECGLSVDL